jgi:Pectate lyase superfamily protein
MYACCSACGRNTDRPGAERARGVAVVLLLQRCCRFCGNRYRDRETVLPEGRRDTAGMPPTAVGVVDTVLGAVAPPGPGRTGFLAGFAPGSSGVEALIARGCVNPGDGGGGVFVWLPTSRAPDDGGTVVIPNQFAAAMPPPDGRWHRVYAGALDVRWFGAQANASTTNDTAAFASAIAASAGIGPAANREVFVPPGQYLAQLTLPRRGVNAGGIVLRGSGPASTQIMWNGAGATVEFSHADDTQYALYYRFSSIAFRHTTPGGTAFRHAPDPTLAARMLYAAFEDVMFQSDGVAQDANHQPVGNEPVAELRSMFNSRLDRVTLRGSAGLLVTGSRNHLADVHTLLDGEQTDGVVLAPCGESILDTVRIDGLFGNIGDGIRLSGCSLVSIRNSSFEGKRGRSCIRIEDSTNITLDNCNMGGAPFANVPWAALWITGASDNIRIDGGRINVFDITGLRIDPGGRSIHGREIQFPQSSAAATGTFPVIDALAPDIRLELITGTNARVELAHTVGPSAFRGTILLLQRWHDLFVSDAPLIEHIMQGTDDDGPALAAAPPGRRVTLFLSGGVTTVASGGSSTIRLVGNTPWTPTGQAMIELVFDGTLWWEVARNG